MKECPSGKKKYDKKGAVSFKNLTEKLHNIKSDVYECNRCGFWHLTTIGNNHRFRHNLNLRKRKT